MTITLSEQDKEQYTSKIQEILDDSTYQDAFSRKFLASLKDRLAKSYNYNVITEKQVDYFNRVVTEYRGREQWEKDYKEKYLETAKIIAKYHGIHGLYLPLVQTINADEIPSQSYFLRTLNNDYTVRMLENYHTEPKFEVGDFIMTRKRLPSMGSYFDNTQRDYSLQPGIIVSRQNKVYNATKGSRGYEILFNFNSKIKKVQERDLKETNDRNLKTVKNSDTSEKKRKS